MKKAIFLICTLLATCGAFAQSAHTYEMATGEFTELKVLANVRVVYQCNPDSIGYAHYTGADQYNDTYVLTRSGNALKVQVQAEDANLPDIPVLYVYSSFLNHVSNDGNQTVTVIDPAPCPNFKARQVNNGTIDITNLRVTNLSAEILTGRGNIELTGTANKASYKLTGTGTIHAEQLKANEVSCSTMGTGAIYLDAAKKLKVLGFGATKIYYWGSPDEVKKQGLAKLFDMSDYGTVEERPDRNSDL